MTTRVLVVNLSNDHVHKVEVRGQRPNLVDDGNGNMVTVTYPLGTLPPGAHAEFYVYDSQALLITETKE